jgi:hypothetical protein
MEGDCPLREGEMYGGETSRVKCPFTDILAPRLKYYVILASNLLLDL